MANFPKKLLFNSLVAVFVCFWLTSCNQKETVESVPKINLIAPSGIQVARSVEQLEAKIANIFSIHFNDVNLISVEFLEAKDGYSYRAKFVNKFTNETPIHSLCGR
ncbi:hypothetical protein [Siphonobacter sp. SORGH_AS_0500]|uniref:hypothetical protein n=1 Tax=Siphonobacter sp. SORGH_AS_0500 TaxID=1864824 RepID=UPI0028621EDD|nr:hypothetical protein [Siphonobacter sp. SORGH_AS_0500]MDR6194842.1 hypothetical protein [Siphonobacter sp. SORGH_AS_0500]